MSRSGDPETTEAYVRALLAENKLLRAALEPFQRNVEALSLSRALGHIGREELWAARKAYEQTQG